MPPKRNFESPILASLKKQKLNSPTNLISLVNSANEISSSKSRNLFLSTTTTTTTTMNSTINQSTPILKGTIIFDERRNNMETDENVIQIFDDDKNYNGQMLKDSHEKPDSFIDKPRSSKVSSQNKIKESPSNPSREKIQDSNVKLPKSHKFISPTERLREFPNQSLEVDLNKLRLRCVACKLPIDNKKDNLKKHIASKNHLENLKKLEKLKVDNQSLKQFVQGKTRLAGEGKNVEDEAICFRIKVVTRFLRAGIPLAKVDDLRELLEENSPYKLTDSEHLRPLTKDILAMELKTVKDDIDGTILFLKNHQ